MAKHNVYNFTHRDKSNYVYVGHTSIDLFVSCLFDKVLPVYREGKQGPDK